MQVRFPMSKLGLIFHLELHQEPWGSKELMTERFRGVLYWLRMPKAANSRNLLRK